MDNRFSVSSRSPHRWKRNRSKITLDDAELNVPDSAGFEKDLPLDSPVAGGTDEMETMLDLAKAYIDMGDEQNAYKALKDIAARGNPLQQTEANELLKKLN